MCCALSFHILKRNRALRSFIIVLANQLTQYNILDRIENVKQFFPSDNFIYDFSLFLFFCFPMPLFPKFFLPPDPARRRQRFHLLGTLNALLPRRGISSVRLWSFQGTMWMTFPDTQKRGVLNQMGIVYPWFKSPLIFLYVPDTEFILSLTQSIDLSVTPHSPPAKNIVPGICCVVNPVFSNFTDNFYYFGT